jgi:hypothetical protein
MRAELRVVVVAIALTGCFSGPTLEDEPCPPGGTALTYDNFGAAFFGQWCEGCHAADAVHRHGAPHAYTFDTVEEIREHAARIFERAAASNTSMPPGPDDPSEPDRERLAEWLACGAP